MRQNLLPPKFKTLAEAKSLDIRKQLGLRSTQACPARLVAELYNVSVTASSSLLEVLQADLRELFPDQALYSERLTWVSNPECKFSALAAIVGEHRMILYNDSNSLARQESDIMHELAHIICEHPGDCLQLNADIALRQHNDSHEEEAKWLGATLQVPDQGLYQLVRAGHTTERIAEIYGCSIEMAIYRRRITAVDRRLSYIKPKPQF